MDHGAYGTFADAGGKKTKEYTDEENSCNRR